ncbi:unnamed protein product [Bacillus phage SPP1]|uniref:Bacteriophage SPP1 complete nucleotide sequence n=1 Tax=Bacillus phage SPP1 TaxID=10724 RepID=Q38075_BPSPP|nr:hypothetical protein SPP1p098 [Bacillus phage SPP1]CAA46749.1 unnamed protein product [Bacillus phage SPP1]CAA66508.1 unnamed protein product [Bacillus phage SPP1]
MKPLKIFGWSSMLIGSGAFTYYVMRMNPTGEEILIFALALLGFVFKIVIDELQEVMKRFKERGEETRLHLSFSNKVMIMVLAVFAIYGGLRYAVSTITMIMGA